ncbi:THAP domain-containing protein [Ooceraea biroi]|uniref:THAP domain-containing protein n=1 Tax=Ooceraea biroi TaxID=2015173 RepID=A0A026WR26_OOCBI|nr:THAP domain-containing protein [Ooceraea biroi]
MKEKGNEYINYIKGLGIIENKHSTDSIPILKGKRKTVFWGFIIAMKSVSKLSRYVFENNSMSCILTYKLSQDHLETFFSCIRRMGVYNNNPTCRQLTSSYKNNYKCQFNCCSRSKLFFARYNNIYI